MKCWCGEGYRGHNQDHDDAEEITDKIYLIIRDGWGRNETLEQISNRIWNMVENSILGVMDNIEATVRR